MLGYDMDMAKSHIGVDPVVLLITLLAFLSCGSPADTESEAAPPLAVQITGISDGGVYSLPVTPEWDTAPGTTDDTLLSRDFSPVPGYQKGDALLDNGIYALVVTTTRTANGLTAITTVWFMLNDDVPTEVVSTNTGESGVELDVYVYGGSEFTANPLYAMWVEDLSGTFVQNLFVSAAPGTNVYGGSGWVARPQSVPYWNHKSCIEDPYSADPTHNTTGMYLALPTADGGPIPGDLDAVSGATRKVDFLLHTTRLNDGLTQFQVMFEINRSRDFNAYYTDPAYEPVGQPSLVYGATIDVDSGQKFYTMSLLGSGHPDGSDGALYGTSNHTTALDLVDDIVVQVKE